jgi:FkbM family methyltransferase
LTGDFTVLSSIIDQEVYFPKFMILDNNEVFVDVGAYDGDTLESFIKKVDSRFRAIHAFEPESNSYNKIRKRYISDKRITIYPWVLYDKQCFLSLDVDPGGMHTKISINQYGQASGFSALACRLDDVFSGNSLPTYIKIDAEGSEQSILNGSVNTLKSVRPKIALSVYHRPIDLWSLPIYISSLGLNYKLYLRHYTETIADTVLYCIPISK